MKILAVADLVIKEGEHEQALGYANETIDFGKNQDGFVSAFMTRNSLDPNRYLVVTVWENENAYANMLSNLGSKGLVNYLKMIIHLRENPVINMYQVLN